MSKSSFSLPQGIDPNLVNAFTYFKKGTTANRRYIAGMISATALATVATTVNFLYAIPFIVARDQKFDIASINVTSAALATGVCRIGVYRNDEANLYPSTLVFDSGDIDVTTTGVKDVTIPAANQLFTKGLYWASLNTGSQAPTLRRLATGGMYGFFHLDATMGTSVDTAYGITHTYGALPATFPANATIQALSYPAIGFRPV